MRTTISIIIPTYNPNSILLRTLELISDISANNRRYSIELIIVNTVSRTPVEGLIKSRKYPYDIKIINIQKSQFNHGATRNLGVRKSKGKYVIFLSQDAYPLDQNFIDHFIEDLQPHKTVAVFGKEIAPENSQKNFRLFEHSLWFEQYEPRYDKKGRVWFSLKLKNKSNDRDNEFFWYSLSNVFSCYKADFLKKHPFETIYYGEDVLMGKYIIENGFQKVFDSRCRVEHFHSDLKSYIDRNLSDWYFRIFVLKSPVRVKLKEKITSTTSKKPARLEIYGYYFLKAAILILILMIRLKQRLLTYLFPQKKWEFISRHL